MIPTDRPFPWRTLMAVTGIITVAAIALSAWKHTLDRINPFSARRITETFISEIPTIRGTAGDVLELASSRSVETFRVEDAWRLWDLVDLGTNVSEIRVPATFRYHLRLSDPWQLEIRGNVCLVRAPAIRPTLPPAIHTDGMEKRQERGWLRFDAAPQIVELEKSLTERLSQRAADPAHMRLAREECRRSVEAFVKTWLLREKQWREDKFTAVRVVFPDESADPDSAAAPPPGPQL